MRQPPAISTIILSKNPCLNLGLSLTGLFFKFTSAIIIILTVSCGSHSNQIGEPVNTNDAVSINVGLKNFIEKNQKKCVVFGKVAEVCQSEGCWFSYQTDFENLTVDFADLFTVPKNIANKDIYALGYFYRDSSKDEKSGQKMIAVKFRAAGVKFK